jgi:hypothetical protein
MYIFNYKSSRTLRNLVAQRVVSCLTNAQKLAHMLASAISKTISGIINRIRAVKMGEGLDGAGGEERGEGRKREGRGKLYA